ncbi:trypsin-like peptidase domain-containing protein [Ramlibacter sp. G-1-2-2]|uniref:Trypsin-like peptidase domain-containing protein n=1 Tax=Ramlibacter agri TaxID=2728837 RepID=A0A848GZH8_9BURK|nr:trypsin-like peptidase domain-containing protein [Ramlibacter agri]
MAESLLMSVTRLSTFLGDRVLTAGSGFFYESKSRLYLVTSRHVFIDEAAQHRPDRVEFVVHTDATNLARWQSVSMPLYQGGRAAWRQAMDSGGEIDVAAIEVNRALLPADFHVRCFRPESLPADLDIAEVGTPLLLVGFPLGFYDTVHHLPVVRQAIVASSFGVRFQGQGYFLTDARMHRGASGAPVVLRRGEGKFPWALLGVHSSRLDMGNRDVMQDESLGLNCAWYSDVLKTLVP